MIRLLYLHSRNSNSRAISRRLGNGGIFDEMSGIEPDLSAFEHLWGIPCFYSSRRESTGFEFQREIEHSLDCPLRDLAVSARGKDAFGTPSGETI